MSNWVLLPNLSVVSDATTGPLGDPVTIGNATGISIGRGNPGATVPSVEEGRELANNALAKARALGSRDANAEDHFDSHGEKLWRALGSASGQRPGFDAFIAELRRLVSSGDLRLVAAVVIAKKADALPRSSTSFRGRSGARADDAHEAQWRLAHPLGNRDGGRPKPRRRPPDAWGQPLAC